MVATWKKLVVQAQDSALAAVQVFNNPSIRFKSETFIMLMNVAWTYLLHAHFQRRGVEYRYFTGQGKGRRYDRTADGNFKYWDLRKCLRSEKCPIDNEARKNLEFLIGLRDEITHHMSPELDHFASARYQAACLNFNHYIKKLFGDQHGIDAYLSYSLQFSALSREQLAAPNQADLPANVRSYIAEFDDSLTVDELNSDRFAYRMLFVPKLVGKPGQADETIEFLRADDEITKSVNKDLVSFKEVEKPKVRASDVVRQMNEAGFPLFNMHHHTQLWKEHDAKNPAKNFGTDIAGYWYWYQRWVDLVRRHCEKNPADYRLSS